MLGAQYYSYSCRTIAKSVIRHFDIIIIEGNENFIIMGINILYTTTMWSRILYIHNDAAEVVRLMIRI